MPNATSTARKPHAKNAKATSTARKPHAKNAMLVLQFAISAVLLAAIIIAVDPAQFAKYLFGIRPEFFLASTAAYFCVNLLMSYRIKVLLGAMGEKLAFRGILLAHYLGMLASDFTPARSGYFACSLALNRKGVPLSKAVSSILAPQLFDFLLKAGVASIAIAMLLSQAYLPDSSLLLAVLAVAVVAGFALAIAALLFYPPITAPLQSTAKFLPFGKKFANLAELLHKNSQPVKENLGIVLGILFASWVLKGVEWWMLAEAVGITPSSQLHPLLFFMLLHPALTLLQFIPLPTPAGAGVSEAGLVAYLVLFGVSAPAAAVFGVLSRAVMLVQDWVGIFEAPHLDLSFIEEEKW